MKIHLFLLITLILTSCSYSGNRAFYVSPSGNDSNPGTKGKPFLSFSKAKEVVAKVIKDGAENQEIHVYFRGGTYYFDKSVVIKGKELGSGNNTIIFSAYQEEKPVFSSGKLLAGWNKLSDDPPFLPETARGKVWVTNIPERGSGTIARFLCTDSVPLVNAVSEGLLTGENDNIRKIQIDHDGGANYDFSEVYSSFIFPENSLREWDNLSDIEIITRPHYAWLVNILPLKSIDIKNKTAYTAIPATYFICKIASEPFYPNLWVQNAIDYLDKPGEWVINSVEGKIYYWPKEGDPSGVYYPVLQELIRVEGNEKDGSILKNIIFRGITFAHGDRDTWDDDAIGLQHDWALYNESDALLRFVDTEGCVVDNCRFTTSGGGGVRFDLYSQKNKVINSVFNNLGGIPVLFCGYGPGLKDVNKNNEIINNEIHDGGQAYLHSPGIFIWQSGGNRIAHNLIYNFPYNGLVIGGPRPTFFNKRMGNRRELTGTMHFDETGEYEVEDWDKLFPYLFSTDNIIEYNEIHDIVLKLDDGNAIYVSGTGYNTIIRKNYIHDNVSNGRHGAIRADGFAKYLTITENIIYRFARYGVVTRVEDYITNNYIIDYIPTERADGERHPTLSFIDITSRDFIGSIIKKNIFFQSAGVAEPFLKAYFSNPELKLSDCAIDSNIYFATGVNYSNLAQLQELRSQGVDSNSMVADPCFEGLAEAGFKLKSNSPAFKLGIKQIDFENIGLLKSKMTY